MILHHYTLPGELCLPPPTGPFLLQGAHLHEAPHTCDCWFSDISFSQKQAFLVHSALIWPPCFKNKHLRTGHSATLPSSLPRCPLLIQVILHTWHGKSIPSGHHVLPYPAVTLSHVIIYTGDVFTFCSLAPSHPHCNTLFSPCLNSSTHFHNIFS